MPRQNKPQPHTNYFMPQTDFTDAQLAAMTDPQAQSQLVAAALELNRESGMDLGKCWQRIRYTLPKLYARATAKAGDVAPALANAAAAPLWPQAYFGLMQLPADTTADEFLAAWYSNKGKAQPLDGPAVFDGLVANACGKMKLTTDAARDYVTKKFPAIVKAVKAL